MDQHLLTEEEIQRIDEITDEKTRRRIDRELEQINRRYDRLRQTLRRIRRNGKYSHNIV